MCIYEAMQVRLGEDETIDVWDWHALEEIARTDGMAKSPEFTLEFADEKMCFIEQFFVGTIRQTSLTATDAIRASTFSAAKAMVPELKGAQMYREAEVSEPGQELMNIFEVPCNGGCLEQYDDWKDHIMEGVSRVNRE